MPSVSRMRQHVSLTQSTFSSMPSRVLPGPCPLRVVRAPTCQALQKICKG